MCADLERQQAEEHPDRWRNDFDELSEIYAFAYGNLMQIVLATLDQKKPREYLREQYSRHSKAYRDTLGHYFAEIGRHRKADIRAAYRAARQSNESNAV